MALTKAVVEQRIKDITIKIQQKAAEVDRVTQEWLQWQGALEDCKFWLAQFADSPEDTDSPAEVVDDGLQTPD